MASPRNRAVGSIQTIRRSLLIDRAWEVNDWTDLGTFVDHADDEDAASYQIQTFQRPISEHDLRDVVVHSFTLDGRIDNDLNSIKEDFEDAVGQEWSALLR